MVGPQRMFKAVKRFHNGEYMSFITHSLIDPEKEDYLLKGFLAANWAQILKTETSSHFSIGVSHLKCISGRSLH